MDHAGCSLLLYRLHFRGFACTMDRIITRVCVEQRRRTVFVLPTKLLDKARRGIVSINIIIAIITAVFCYTRGGTRLLQ